MGFDRTAHAAQVGRIAAHYAGEDVLLRWSGQTDEIPAVCSRDRQPGTPVTRERVGSTLVVLTIARVAITTARPPRQQEHFTDAQGKTYRITEDRSVPHDPQYIYACSSA
jgi:hypothetical protein